MTVAELRAALRALPAGAGTWIVMLSRDSAGNRFSFVPLGQRRGYDRGLSLPADAAVQAARHP